MSVCIRLDELNKRYGSTLAVKNLSLEIETGEIFGLLGPNGAGKSTTLYMLAGLARPSSGSITIFGKDMQKQPLEIISRMGVLFERPSFYDHLTVGKNLLLMARLSGREVTIDRTLDMVGILHLSDQKVGTLSTGMRQRLGLAQALLTEPELLLLDEPTSSLDVEQAQETIHLLRRLAKEASVTIVLSSHTMDEVEALCDRVAVINNGSLVLCDKADTLISYDRTQVEVLMESPEAAARQLREEDWVEAVEVSPGRIHVRLNEPNPHKLNAFLVGAGFQVLGLIPRRRTLQEFFIKAMNR